MTWQPVTYDPELNHIYVSTGNPQPVIAHKNRTGDNLYTGAFVALNADTGKMAWYFQSSPHDTHDWDSTQTPVVFDGVIDGKPRKLIAQAARNGHFFVHRSDDRQGDHLDRVREDELVVRLRREGSTDSRIRRRNRRSTARSSRRIRAARPTGRRRASARRRASSTSAPSRAFSIFYLYDIGDNPMGWGGTDRGGYSESMIQAIDYKTGKVRWTHQWESNIRSGLLSTAGQPAVRRRTVAGHRRAERDDRRRAVARAPQRRRQQRTDHLRDGRPPVPHRRRRRHALGVRDE